MGSSFFFPVAPDIFHRIELRGVGGQLLGDQPTTLGGNELLGQARLMRRQAIPQHQQFALKVAQQVTEKVHHLWSADGIWIKPEIEVPPANTGGDREQFPVEVVLQEKYRVPGTGNLWLDFGATHKFDAAEVAAFVVWLCTDAAANVTGRTFQIGAGQVALYSEPDLVRSAFRKEGSTVPELEGLSDSGCLTGSLCNPYEQSARKYKM